MSTLYRNKTATYNFKIEQEFEAGLVLTGQEVKSVKAKHLSLKGAFVSIKDGQAWLKKMHITPYSKASVGLKN